MVVARVRWTVVCVAGVLGAACRQAEPPVRVLDGLRITPDVVRHAALPTDLTFVEQDLRRALPPEQATPLDALLPECLDASGGRAVSAAVYLPGNGCWVGACSRDAQLQIDPDTRFHAASITKAMTAALVLQLIEQGHVSLETTVDRWFPGLPRGAEITVDHLLSHTSGLTDPALELPDSARSFRTADEVLASVQRGELAFAPGTRWSYCNAGYQLLGEIVAREFDAPFDEVLEQRLWQPLGLTRACWVKSANQREVLPDSVVGGRSGFEVIDYAVPLAAGSVAATPRDLVRWHAALLGSAVLRPETAARMLDRLLPMSPGSLWWGRGLMLLRMPDPIGEVIYSAGGIQGFQSALAWLPSKRAFVAVMTIDETPAGPFLWRLANAL
ncbi:MAG: beta-lactamase family protein [Planctomycetes bacterium]|nr:beta-lactamase family protein [Planctomycetota bacterium]